MSLREDPGQSPKARPHTGALLGCSGRNSEAEAPVSDRAGTSSSPRSHDKALRRKRDRLSADRLLLSASFQSSAPTPGTRLRGRRGGAQGRTPASRQRSCLGAPVRPSARCWVGRMRAAASTRRGARPPATPSMGAGVSLAGSSRLLGTSSERRATSCSRTRFLRNVIAKEAATPSSFESRSGSIRTRDPCRVLISPTSLR